MTTVDVTERAGHLQNALIYMRDVAIPDMKEPYKAQFILMFVYLIGIVVINVTAAFLANIEGFLTTIGVTITSIFALIKKLKETLYGFYVEPKILKSDANSLIARVQMSHNHQMLDDIEKAIYLFLDRVDKRKLI